MSLDVWLTEPGANRPVTGSGIFVREGGSTREITEKEWNAKHPNMPAVEMAPSSGTTDVVFDANITHNLANMAGEAGLYFYLWRPEEVGIKTARELVEPLGIGLKTLIDDPAKFEALNPANGWGSYVGLVNFVRTYLTACKEHPNAIVNVSR